MAKLKLFILFTNVRCGRDLARILVFAIQVSAWVYQGGQELSLPTWLTGMAGQLVLAVDLGFSQRPQFFLTQTSVWGCLPLLPQSMKTRNERFNRQEVDTANSLKPGPRNCHSMISVIFCCSVTKSAQIQVQWMWALSLCDERNVICSQPWDTFLVKHLI